ncbi:oxidoreductase [Demequina aurantiaca]|uniref:oxidoreductase n=1 Tax=Demequina aurantiaca TaxID=676200 RepID=UPI003D33617D
MTKDNDIYERQRPMSSAFGYRSTAADVLEGHDLSGVTAVVTGGYSGLGFETVAALADAGAAVIVPARRPEAAAAKLEGFARVTVEKMDLSDLDSVAAFTAKVREAATPIGMMINAAGVMATPEKRTAQGWEFQFGTNHLGHFALTAGLSPLLTTGARVISYSSIGHYRSPVRFDDINFEASPYEPWEAYGQAKSANALFAVGLNARAESRGILAFSVHPGGIMTDLQRNMPAEELLARGWVDAQGNPNPLFKTAAEGASTALWAATAPELANRGGVYCEDCSIKSIVPVDYADMMEGGVKDWAVNPDAAEALWALSVKATGLDAFGS